MMALFKLFYFISLRSLASQGPKRRLGRASVSSASKTRRGQGISAESTWENSFMRRETRKHTISKQSREAASYNHRLKFSDGVCHTSSWEPPEAWVGHKATVSHEKQLKLYERQKHVIEFMSRALIHGQRGVWKTEHVAKTNFEERAQHIPQTSFGLIGQRPPHFRNGITLRKIWEDDEYEKTEQKFAKMNKQAASSHPNSLTSNLLVATSSRTLELTSEDEMASLHEDWRWAVKSIKAILAATQAASGHFDWLLDEGTLLASLRWGAMWGSMPDFGLDVVDDDFDILLFAKNRNHSINIINNLATHAKSTGSFVGITFDPVASQFGQNGDLCGALQMDYLGKVLVDIKIILLDNPMTCNPCRLHPSAHTSPICGASPLQIARGCLHGEDVPVQPLHESMVQLAIDHYWKPEGPNKEAALGIILPHHSSGLQRGKNYFTYQDALALWVSASNLCRRKYISFAPILNDLPFPDPESKSSSHWSHPGEDLNDDSNRALLQISLLSASGIY